MTTLRISALVLAAIGLAALLITAQTPAAPPAPTFTATTDNVSTHDSVRITLLRWSTDAERDQLLDAWNLKSPVRSGGRGGRGGPGRGAAAGGDGFGFTDPALDDPSITGGAPAGGRGAGRGGRGGRGGAGAAEAPRRTPEASLAEALGKAQTVGYLWSSEVAGYALRYAVRLAQPDGGERIFLLTDRRLGAWNDSWKPTAAGAAPANYEFSLIELRLNSKGEGEGKTSLTGKVAVDSAAKTIALEDYSASPVIFKNVRLSK